MCGVCVCGNSTAAAAWAAQSINMQQDSLTQEGVALMAVDWCTWWCTTMRVCGCVLCGENENGFRSQRGVGWVPLGPRCDERSVSVSCPPAAATAAFAVTELPWPKLLLSWRQPPTGAAGAPGPKPLPQLLVVVLVLVLLVCLHPAASKSCSGAPPGSVLQSSWHLQLPAAVTRPAQLQEAA